ncbi:hypothetical protein [Brevibacterium casei]
MFACLSVAELEAGGLTTYQIALAEECCLRRSRRGHYVITRVCADPRHRFISALASAQTTHLPKESAGLRKRKEDLRILVRSYARSLPPNAVFSHRSALIVHGLPIPFFEDGETICAETVHPRNAVRRPTMLIRRRELEPGDTVEVGGVPVTSVLRTLFDISRDCPLAFAVAVVDDALRCSLVTLNEFREFCARHPVRTHQARIDAVLDNADGRRETVAESICAIRFVEHSIHGFEPQVVIEDEQGEFIARTDFADEAAKVIAEFDGAGKYYLDGADPKESFELERRREYALRNLGYTVFRITWADLFAADVFLRIKDVISRRTANPAQGLDSRGGSQR